MKQKEIIDYAKSIGIEAIGFCDINFSEFFKEKLMERKRLNCLSGFEESDENTRMSPNLLLQDASTIISIALPYRINEPDRTLPYMSKSAMGMDYHRVMKEKLGLLGDFINQKYGASSIALCDTSPLHDREIAYKCGIGFYGKNTNIISPIYGSFIFLGELITDIYIERSSSIESRCGECNLCMKACPAQALESPYFLNAQKCLSFVTQKKEQLTKQEIRLSACRVYGCDTCQDVCPYNKNSGKRGIKEFQAPIYNPIDILSMTNRQFKHTIGMTSAGWRGKGILTRNLINAMGNSGRREYLEMLQQLRNEKPDLAYYIDIAIEKLSCAK